MIFIFFIIFFLIISSISNIENKASNCKPHKWIYDPNNDMRCKICNKTPMDLMK